MLSQLWTSARDALDDTLAAQGARVGTGLLVAGFTVVIAAAITHKLIALESAIRSVRNM
jgi:hypothetical protein